MSKNNRKKSNHSASRNGKKGNRVYLLKRKIPLSLLLALTLPLTICLSARLRPIAVISASSPSPWVTFYPCA